MLDVLLDTFVDSIKLIPFLYFTYLLMEYMERRTGLGFQKKIKKAGRFGPVWGGLLGAFPQCGFSAAATSLFSGRVISLGTLLAVYLSTSDEMLPIFISEKISPVLILEIIGLKIVIGIAVGFLFDIFLSKYIVMKRSKIMIGQMCVVDNCGCQRKNIFLSSLIHSSKILGFIFAITLALNTLVFYVGEETLSGLIMNQPVLGPVLAGIVGLIPNCAASVVITQLYLANVIGFGTMMSGLLVGAGVGLLILFRVNSKRMKENLKILGCLYGIGVLAGIIIECITMLL